MYWTFRIKTIQMKLDKVAQSNLIIRNYEVVHLKKIWILQKRTIIRKCNTTALPPMPPINLTATDMNVNRTKMYK